LIPLKRAGIYGEGEKIVIIARFNKPVIVTGIPTLLLTTGKDTTGNATFLQSFSSFDLPIDFQESDLLFEYYVQLSDNVLSLHHTDENALILSNGATILHKTLSPITLADIILRDPSDHVPINGLVLQQWKFRYPQKVEVLVRDLYHTQAQSLTLTLEHKGHFSKIFDGCCEKKTFGHSYPRSRLGTNATIHESDTGIGYTYMFSDTPYPNIALQGAVSQSSTAVSPLKAIDGNVNPLIGQGSVTKTDDETNAWWQILLPPGSTVYSMNIFPRKPEVFIVPIISLTIKASDAFPRGTFKLRFTNIDIQDSTITSLSDFIEMGIDAAGIKLIIESVPGLGAVNVDRIDLPLCGVHGSSGCGEGDEHGYGHTYVFEFLNIQVAEPVITMESLSYIGGSVTNGGTGETTNDIDYQFISRFETTRIGKSIQVPEVEIMGEGIDRYVNENSTEIPAVHGDNEWLTPFWVMLFDDDHSPPPADLEASLVNCQWKRRYYSIDNLLQIVLHTPMANISYLKIQRIGYGALSLAEVEIYEGALNTMQYALGNPVTPNYITKPYQSEDPFAHAFNNLEFDGRWLLQFKQNVDTYERDVQGFSGSYGTVSDVVLIITDLAGIVHTYYQDLRAQITSLPKFGRVFNAVAHTPSPYGNWRESFEVGLNGELVLRSGKARNLGFCYGNDDTGLNGYRSGVDKYRFCTDNYGVRPELSTYMDGDTPETYYLRYERMISYKPNQNYLGPDSLSYIIHDGLNVQNHIIGSKVSNSAIGTRHELTIHVRNCRRYAGAIARLETPDPHPLCICAQDEFEMITNKPSCDIVRRDLCANSETEQLYLAMCLPCTRLGFLSGECSAQTIRAVNMVKSKDLCSGQPLVDCDAETIGSDKTTGGSSAYLTLRPPLKQGMRAYTMLNRV
jgi:hypothetical protein